MNDSEITEFAASEAKELIEGLGFGGEISADMSVGDNERKYVTIDIEGEDLALLIGFQGNTLRALEHILSLIINRRLRSENQEAERVRVRIDVNNYRAKREENIKSIALQAIGQVKESDQEFELSPMNPAERRIVHMVIREEEGVSSESVGEEGERRIIIKPD